MADPLKFVRCRCNSRMEFMPVRLKYRAPCKCDECGDAVPRLSYIYHCPKDRMDEHRTAHRLFDYCFACAYKKNPALANSTEEPNMLQVVLASSFHPQPWLTTGQENPTVSSSQSLNISEEENKETEAKLIQSKSVGANADEENRKEPFVAERPATERPATEHPAQLELLQQKLQTRTLQIQSLERELQKLREEKKRPNVKRREHKRQPRRSKTNRSHHKK